ncbi:ribonuclease P protein component [Floricoccus penangensis]|uniref:Ribonuclease P protein component n=1 Tax=Floricoccus penangensis TaxID=1859475 RepID=A0A9Q5JH41_9LACT|nr:ribonuclease P protein component [Floricoccus penangensis]OFI47274.1 ribonuclease P protein component [Floricoccus penangensis]
MKKSYRIKSSQDFQRILGKKDTFANRKFVIYKDETSEKHYRVGISVGKKIGNAVTRNRVKRLVRHSLMEFSPNIESFDFLVIVRVGVEDLDFTEIKKNLKHALKHAEIYRDGDLS